jgi:hypothetical protein
MRSLNVLHNKPMQCYSRKRLTSGWRPVYTYFDSPCRHFRKTCCQSRRPYVRLVSYGFLRLVVDRFCKSFFQRLDVKRRDSCVVLPASCQMAFRGILLHLHARSNSQVTGKGNSAESNRYKDKRDLDPESSRKENNFRKFLKSMFIDSLNVYKQTYFCQITGCMKYGPEAAIILLL